MLKHVSHRASNTSISRSFVNSRSSSLSPNQSAEIQANIVNGHKSVTTISAPSSPRSSQCSPRGSQCSPRGSQCSTGSSRYTECGQQHRKHSLQLNGSKSCGIDTVDYRSSTLNRSHRIRNCSLPKCVEEGSPSNSSERISSPESSPAEEPYNPDSVNIKSDDPLSQHTHALTDVACLGTELATDDSDTVSLQSAVSFSSLCRHDFSSSSGCLPAAKVPVRIHLRQLRPGIEYKTLRLDPATSCRQLIEQLLLKLRLKHRDPNLFAVVLEAAVRGPDGGSSVKRRFLLEDSARPVELQQCRPRGEALFSVTTRRGGVLRVEDSVLTPGSRYKSVLVSYSSSAVDVIKLLLRCNNRSDDWRMFTLHEQQETPFKERLLNDDEKPLYVQNSWPRHEKQNYSLVLRRHGIIEPQTPWRPLSVDEMSCDELEEHNITCSSICTSSTDSGRSRGSISSSTASVLSLNSISSGSSRCSLSSNGSSSGVSSGSSSSGCPLETPEKMKINKFVNRPLPPLPVSVSNPMPHQKRYSISAEENVQSYFSLQSEDEGVGSLQSTPTTSNETVKFDESVEISAAKRPPQPLPRRQISVPVEKKVYANTNDNTELKTEASEHKGTEVRTRSKSAHSVFFPPLNWIRSRESTTPQNTQHRSRFSRICSFAASTPNGYIQNNPMYGRSRSIDLSRASSLSASTTTLTSPPSTPTLLSPSSTSPKKRFNFSLPPLCRALSTSSLNSSYKNASFKSIYERPVIPPLSSKLRPLSLAPNSSINFPEKSRGSLSQSSATLTSTTTLCPNNSGSDEVNPNSDGNNNSEVAPNGEAASKSCNYSITTKHSGSISSQLNIRFNESVKTAYAKINLTRSFARRQSGAESSGAEPAADRRPLVRVESSDSADS